MYLRNTSSIAIESITIISNTIAYIVDVAIPYEFMRTVV